MESLAQEIDFEKREEAFLAQLFDCVLLEARITMRQCELNQRKAHSEFPGRNYLCLKCTQEKTPIETVLTPPAAVEKLVPAGGDAKKGGKRQSFTKPGRSSRKQFPNPRQPLRPFTKRQLWPLR